MPSIYGRASRQAYQQRPMGDNVPTTGSGPYEGNLSGASTRKAASGYINRYLVPQEQGRRERAEERQGAYDQALADPRAQANLFSSYFNDAAQGFAAPAMRDFQNQLAGVQGNTAARFGGNASSAELKNVYNTSDLFSRNLSEALARLAPQAAGMGLQYTGMLGGAADQAAAERDRLSQLILGATGQLGQGGQQGGSFLGSLIGGVGGFLAGGPAGAAAGAYQGYRR